MVSEPCKVIAVDVEAGVCDVEPLNGTAQVLDVLLNAGGDKETSITQVPKIDSIVYITYYDRNNAFVSLISELESLHIKNSSVYLELSEKLLLNGDQYGGIVRADELKKELDKTKEVLDGLLAVINGAPIPELGGGAPSGLQTALKGAVAGKGTGDYSNIENENVLNG